MSTIVLPNEFRQSLLDIDAWPSNLIRRTTNAYPAVLKALKSRLDDEESDLFEEDEDAWEVPIRDKDTAAGQKLKKCNAHDKEKLKTWMEVQVKVDPNNPNSKIVTASQKDPKCRFM